MISIIIPTHCRAESLSLLLESLRGEVFTFGASALEVIVVVDGYDAPSLEVMRGYSESLPLKYVVHEEAQGAAVARNAGVGVAQGSVFAFLDDDVVVKVGWLDELRRLISDQRVDIWSGAVTYKCDSYRGCYPDRIVQNKNAGFPLGAHLIVRRSAFLPFDPLLAELHNEDTGFILMCLEGGARLSPAPSLQVFHFKSWWKSPFAVIAAAKHNAALPILIKRYPKHFKLLPIPSIGPLLFPREFAVLVFLPVLIVPLFIRYLYLRSRREHFVASLPYFLAKWPAALLMRRLHLWKSAWKNKVFVI